MGGLDGSSFSAKNSGSFFGPHPHFSEGNIFWFFDEALQSLGLISTEFLTNYG